MNTNSKSRSTQRALLGTLAALSLMAALVTPAAAGAKVGGGSDVAGHRSGEEIPTLRGGLAGSVGGDSGTIVIPQ